MLLILKRQTNAKYTRMLIGVIAVSTHMINYGARLARTFFRMFLMMIVTHEKQL